MNFKNGLLIIFIIVIFSCKNPFLHDPKFNPQKPEFSFLPVNESDVKWMQPYGYVVYDALRSTNHNGFDFGMKFYLTPLYSCGDGVVTEINYNTGQGLPGTNYKIVIAVSSNTELEYHFEIGGSISETERKNNIFVKSGDYVKAGQKIANLISLIDGSHVHFGIRYNENCDRCPLEFFSYDAAFKLEKLFDSIEKRPARDDLCE